MTTLSAAWLLPADPEDPFDGGAVLLSCGGPLFNAVRTPDALGKPVLDRILANPADADQLGPVLWDERGGLLYWLVSPGHSDDYPDGAALLSAGTWISVPPPYGEATRDAAWIHLPKQRIVSGPAWLAAALRAQVELRRLEGLARSGQLIAPLFRRLDELNGHPEADDDDIARTAAHREAALKAANPAR